MPSPSAKSTPPQDLEAQLDALMARVQPTPESTPESPPAPPPDRAQVQAAYAEEGAADLLDGLELEAAFETVEQALAAVVDAVEDITPPLSAAELSHPAVPELPQTPRRRQTDATPGPTPDATPGPTPAPDLPEDEFVSQVQALLDEDPHHVFLSPEDLLADDPLPPPEAPPAPPPAPAPELSPAAFSEAFAEVVSSADAAPAAAQPPASLMAQIDDLLANHAQEVMDGEFESVTDLLGSLSADDASPFEDDEDETDQPVGTFEPVEQIAEVALPRADHLAARVTHEYSEADLDALFNAPVPTVPVVPAAELAAGALDDDFASGEFEAPEDLLNASATVPAAALPAKEKKQRVQPAKSAAKSPSSAGPVWWRLYFTAAPWQAVLAYLPQAVKQVCALINRPLERLPADIRLAVGCSALALAGPGLLLLLYGLLLA